jgi:hypothetical protein
MSRQLSDRKIVEGSFMSLYDDCRVSYVTARVQPVVEGLESILNTMSFITTNKTVRPATVPAYEVDCDITLDDIVEEKPLLDASGNKLTLTAEEDFLRDIIF